MLLAEIARGGRHDRALVDHDRASLPQRLPHIIFTNELRGRGGLLDEDRGRHG